MAEAFVWPLRLVGLLPPPKDGDLDHIPLLSIPPNCIVNHLVPALRPDERANLCLACSTMCSLMSGTITALRFSDGKAMCYAAKSPRLLQVM